MMTSPFHIILPDLFTSMAYMILAGYLPGVSGVDKMYYPFRHSNPHFLLTVDPGCQDLGWHEHEEGVEKVHERIWRCKVKSKL